MVGVGRIVWSLTVMLKGKVKSDGGTTPAALECLAGDPVSGGGESCNT